ncbi:EamA family transporter [Paenibacillus marinisediminis]
MNMLKYSSLVFLGACSYGTLSTIVKLGIADGYTIQQILGGQYFFGWSFLLVLMLLFSRVRVGWKQAGALLLAGIPMSLTSIFYGYAVEQLPASLAVLLLFQFTWIGIILEAVVERKFPSKAKLISVAVLLVGTILAGGVLEQSGGGWTAKGILFGALSAITFALYIFVSGKVGTTVPVLSKSFLIVTGALTIVMLTFSPAFLYDGSITDGLWKYGVLLALLGIVIPVVFFAIGIPKIGPGMSTILGAAELPAAVIVSVLVLQEEVSVLRWIGITIVLIGIAIPQIRVNRRPQKLNERAHSVLKS